jgi:hypothetical protein
MRISKQNTLCPDCDMSKYLEYEEYFKYLFGMIKNEERRTREIKSRISVEKAAFINNKNLFTSKLDINLRKKLVKC